MESRTYKENFRNLILDMVQKEFENYVSQRGAKRFFEANVDRVIDENIQRVQTRKNNENIYLINCFFLFGSFITLQLFSLNSLITPKSSS